MSTIWLWTDAGAAPRLSGMQRVLVALARRMKELRKQRGLSQEAFADHAGLHRVAVGWIEQGKRIPSLKTLVKISQGFGITLSELLKGVDRGITKKHQ
jgi:transcriptional regulator with XRE-family HTH domain